MADREQDNSSENEQDFTSEENLSGVRRPMNAFFIFCKRHRDIVREKYPHLENRSITKILGEWWANLDPSEKASYTALAKQYKEAFMKAHPDFKWYKLPTPPARTLVTRPSNRTTQPGEKNPTSSENCGITLGKLVDDEQLGGLSSLISTPTSGQLSGNIDSIALCSSSMAYKGVENISKPPKKRYLINGEFQSHSDSSPDDGQDYQMQDSCSTLLEFAEICTSDAVRESASIALNSVEKEQALSSLKSYELPPSSNNTFSSISANTPDPKFNPQNHERAENSPLTTSVKLQTNMCDKTESTFLAQDQPLDLCKNKGKNDICLNSKTITTSHQQLIEHFVDKFLCAKPVPPNHYSSEFFDPVLSKLFSSKPVDVPCSSESKVNHSFTLSVAIESAVDKAYSSDYVKSCPKVQASNVVDCVKNENSEFDTHLNVGTCENNFKIDYKNVAKYNEQSADRGSSSSSDTKSKQIANTISSETKTFSSVTAPSKLNKQELSESNIPESSSKYFCKLMTPPKKSSVWCNLFMNEQLTKNDVKNVSNISNTVTSDFQSPARRSSQRTCKGRRYQALITEGLLQSSKERKQSNSKKSSPSNKAKTKVDSIIENHVFTAPKKKKKKDSTSKSRSVKEQDVNESLFNLDEKIASLPKCSFEHLNKKKKFILESSMSTTKQKKGNAECTTSSVNSFIPSDISEWASISSSGKYKTGNFDLEKQIASLPKCNIDLLSKKKKKEG